MKEKKRKSFIVGVFTVLGILLFIFTIYLIGEKEYVFGRPYKLSVIFKDVKGLQEGDKVLLSGIDIGTVNSLEFTKENRVHVQLSIEQEQFEYIMKDARVTIGSQGVMGAKVVKVLSGSSEAGNVVENDTLKSIEQVEIDDIIRELNSTSVNVTRVSNELVSITQKINRGDGIFGKLFTDTTLTYNLDEAVRNISFIAENFYELSEKVNTGQGLIGKLFADTTLTAGMDETGKNVSQITENLNEITDKINRGEGIFGRMFTDTSLTNNLFITSRDLRSTSHSLSLLAEKLNNDSSALNLLIDDPIFADSLELLIDRLNVGVVEATEAADAVQRSGLIRLFSKKKKKK